MGATPSPAPTPSPSGSGSTPQAHPTPSPQPNYPPIPPLPDVPADAYQRLLNLSSAIDTTTGSLQTAGGKLTTIHTTTNTAVGGIVANSKGEVTNGLNDIWHYTGNDFTNASTPLTSITAAHALGGSPNQLQAALTQHQSDFLNGVPAVEQLKHLVATGFASAPTVAAVQELIDLAGSLTQALGNVNMALWLMINAISTINGGIAYSCSTGLVPGQPFPTFTQQAFAMEGNGGSGGGSGLTATQLQDYLEDQGVDPETALNIALYAEEQGLSLSDLQKMFDGLVQGGDDPEIVSGQIQTLIDNESLSKWLDAQQASGSGGTISDVTALLNNGFDTDDVTALLNHGADLRTTLADAQPLITHGVSTSQIAQWVEQGQNLKGIETLMSQKGLTVDNINNGLSQQTSRNWSQVSSPIRTNMGTTIRHWLNGTVGTNSAGSPNPNDGIPYNNNNELLPGGKSTPGSPNPRGYREYTIDNTGTGNSNQLRVIVDKYGNMWYTNSHYDTMTPIPASFIIQAAGQ